MRKIVLPFIVLLCVLACSNTEKETTASADADNTSSNDTVEKKEYCYTTEVPDSIKIVYHAEGSAFLFALYPNASYMTNLGFFSEDLSLRGFIDTYEGIKYEIPIENIDNPLMMDLASRLFYTEVDTVLVKKKKSKEIFVTYYPWMEVYVYKNGEKTQKKVDIGAEGYDYIFSNSFDLLKLQIKRYMVVFYDMMSYEQKNINSIQNGKGPMTKEDRDYELHRAKLLRKKYKDNDTSWVKYMEYKWSWIGEE